VFLLGEEIGERVVIVLDPEMGIAGQQYIRKFRCAQTSRSNSSGPAKGNNKYGRISTPGASIVDGGTVTLTDSGLRRARCADEWNAQFLYIR